MGFACGSTHPTAAVRNPGRPRSSRSTEGLGCREMSSETPSRRRGSSRCSRFTNDVLSSARHAGENSRLGVAEGATPRNRSGKRTACEVQVWRAVRTPDGVTHPPKGHRPGLCRAQRPGTSIYYLYRCVRRSGSGRNLSGTRDRWGESGKLAAFALFRSRLPEPQR